MHDVNVISLDRAIGSGHFYSNSSFKAMRHTSSERNVRGSPACERSVCWSGLEYQQRPLELLLKVRTVSSSNQECVLLIAVI
jgi:hypothetical protein